VQCLFLQWPPVERWRGGLVCCIGIGAAENGVKGWGWRDGRKAYVCEILGFELAGKGDEVCSSKSREGGDEK
jgi:hypothetical protein